MTKKTILITGFAGDILSIAISKKLADSGIDVVIADEKEQAERGLRFNDPEPIFPITMEAEKIDIDVPMSRRDRRALERNSRKNKT